MSNELFPYKECNGCEYFCNDGADLLGFVYGSCGRDPFKLEEQKCPHRKNKENKE